MSSKAEPTDVYALLVGIDIYAAKGIDDLQGCVNDVRAVEAYLETRSDLNVHLKILIDEEATKANMIDAFENHLGQAQNPEAAFFFFAGHGVSEKTSIKAFRAVEVGDHFESLVCYDSSTLNHASGVNTCLADKEISYLVSQLSLKTQHIVLAFDACHSGDIGREGGDLRALPYSAPARAWKGFCFHDRISEKQALQANTLSELFPEGSFIRFSACKDDQTAKEEYVDDDKRGVFSFFWVNALMNNPNITYRSLGPQLPFFMMEFQEQIPTYRDNFAEPWMLDQCFLGGKIHYSQNRNQIFYNPLKGWLLPMGEIHGVVKLEEIEIYGVEGGTFSAEMKQIHSGYTLINVPPEKDQYMDPIKAYHCDFELALEGKMSIWIKTEDEINVETIRDEFNELNKDVTKFPFVWADSESAADYTLFVNNENYYFLSKEGQEILQEVSRSVPISAQIIYQYFEHIARWKSSLLHKPSESLSLGADCPVIINISNEKGEDIAIQEGNQLILAHNQRAKITLVNQDNETLYCSLLYFSSAFGIMDNLLLDRIVSLDSGEDVYIQGGEAVDFCLEDYQVSHNWEQNTDFLKVIVSSQPFYAEGLGMSDLPLPDATETELSVIQQSVDNERRYEPIQDGRGGSTKEQRAGWTCDIYEVIIQNVRPNSQD